MPFKKLGGPGFYVEDDELAWALYDEYQRTGRYPKLEDVLDRDERVVRTVQMCEWFIRYAEDKDVNVFTHEGKH